MILALVLVAVVLFTRYIGSISTARATDTVWELWSQMAPTSSLRQLRSKRDELMKVRQERSNTSSQDEFAKWARLDRQHLKLKKEYDAMNTTVMGKRQNLAFLISATKFLVSKGLQYSLQLYYCRSAVVWLPHNVLPYYAERFLALPFAPLGSVSATTWMYSVQSTIEAATSLYNRFNSRG